MLKIKFLLRKKATEEQSIYVRITDGRKTDVWARTKETATIDNWDADLGKLVEKILVMKSGKLVEKRDAEAKTQIISNQEVNKRLYDLKLKIEDKYKSVTDEIVNTGWLKELISPSVKTEETLLGKLPTDIADYIDYYIQQKGQNIKKPSLVKARSVKKIIEGFKIAHKLKVLPIDSINNQFKIDFERYCETQNYAKNYTARNIKFIKTICYDAENNGLAVHYQLKKLKTSLEANNIIYLDEVEISQIENSLQPYDYLDNARDWLLISCYTGQRVSDFLNFKKEMIRKDKNKYFIEFKQKKTQKIMYLPLHHKVIEILKKREGEFPRKISDQRYNEYIKEVCKISGIIKLVSGSKQIEGRNVKDIYPKYELVTSHIGRRSFASNNYGKIPTTLIMVATGHSTEKMLLTYIGKTDTQQSHALAEYFYQ